MEDKKFVIYDSLHVCLSAEIKEGCLTLISNVFGEYDSERTYSFSKEDTDKLFSIISEKDFCTLCREKHLIGMEEFLKENDIQYGTFTWVS